MTEYTKPTRNTAKVHAYDDKKVCVVIASHNYGRWIEGAVTSALNQTHNNLFISIVDDASTDDSVDRINKLLCERVELLQVNKLAKGPSYTRNRVFDKYIDSVDVFAILDADDEMKPNKVERLLEVLYSDPAIGVAYGDYHTINVDTGSYVREYKEPFDAYRLMNECIVHSGSLIKSEVIKAVGPYDEEMRVCEDYDLWIRASKKYMIHHVAESLTLVRTHKDNTTNSIPRDVWEKNWARIHQKYSQSPRG